MKKIILLLGFVLACAQGTTKAPALPADEGAKQVARIWKNPDPIQWRRSKWFNVSTDNAITPAWVIISVGDYGCLLENGTVYEPRPFEFYVCPTGWRKPTSGI